MSEPEWDGQKADEQESQVKVAVWVRLLALFFLAAVALVLYAVANDLLVGKAALEWQSAIEVVIGAYLSVLFAYVALTGLTPPKWLFPLGNKIRL